MLANCANADSTEQRPSRSYTFRGHGQNHVGSEDAENQVKQSELMSTLSPLYSHCGEHLSRAKTVKMELLRTLVSERLSEVAEEIFKIVERTIIEYEKELSCSKWVVDSHRRLLDAAKTHTEDSIQMSATDVKLQSGPQQPAASVNVSKCWDEAENTPSEPTDDWYNTNSTHPDSSPASENDQSDQEFLIDIEDDYVKQECDLKVKKPFKCPVCLSGFSSKKTLMRHFKKHPEDNSSLYQCQFCEHYFYRKSEFIIHTRTHRGAKPSQDCKKGWDARPDLLLHKQKHSEEKPRVCFETKEEAETHFRSVTPASETEELDCRRNESGIRTFPLAITPFDKSDFDQESLQPLCLYQIQTADIDKDSSAAVRVDRIKTEPAEAPYNTPHDQLLPSVNPSAQLQGETESKRFNVKNNPSARPSGKSTELIVQFEAGTAQKPYKCPCCTKCFSLTKTLIRHVRIHTEDKSYQCQFCGRNFCQKSDLVNHTRIHTGERPYQCKECHKSFAQKGNLVVHMRKHTGDKLFQCQQCSCSFSQRSSFDCHMQSHR